MAMGNISLWWCVRSVTNILLRHATDYIRMPFARYKVMEAHQDFHAIAHVPRVISLVDTTLISIANPSVLNQTFIIHMNMII